MIKHFCDFCDQEIIDDGPKKGVFDMNDVEMGAGFHIEVSKYEGGNWVRAMSCFGCAKQKLKEVVQG